MPTLLIADCNEAFLLSLAEEVQCRYRVLTCRNGQRALDLLRQEQPEIFVLELTLPELDGLTLLECAAAEGLHPKVLVVTSLPTEYVLDAAQRLGIEYLIRKPCSIRAAADRIEDLSRLLSAPSAVTHKDKLPELLHCLSLSVKHNGYDYLTEGACLFLQNPQQSVTKELYPAIARIFGCKPGHVERSMRSALEAAWERGEPAVWQHYFPGATKRPSNAAFLSRIAAALQE